MISKCLPTVEALLEMSRQRTYLESQQVEYRLTEIGNDMMAAARRCIRYVRLPKDEPLIKEIRETLELDGYAVRREYIRVDMSSSGRMGPGDEFVGWIISW